MNNKQIDELVDLMFDTDMEEVMKEKNTLEYIHKLQQENERLKEEKRKVLNYINKRMIHEGEYYFSKAKHFKNTEFGKDLLQLLGDEKNE